jgi:hypothetical protein
MEGILDDQIITTETQDVRIEKDRAIYDFRNHSPQQIADKINAYLSKRGYKLEEGTIFSGKYGKGNKVLRILFGAFVKRFLWEVKVGEAHGITRLVFLKDSKGYIGGIIGVNQVKNEYNDLTLAIQRFHTSCNENKVANATS